MLPNAEILLTISLSALLPGSAALAVSSEYCVCQDEIAAVIAGALQLKLAEESAGPRRRKPNIPAYEAWLKADITPAR